MEIQNQQLIIWGAKTLLHSTVQCFYSPSFTLVTQSAVFVCMYFLRSQKKLDFFLLALFSSLDLHTQHNLFSLSGFWVSFQVLLGFWTQIVASIQKQPSHWQGYLFLTDLKKSQSYTQKNKNSVWDSKTGTMWPIARDWHYCSITADL